MANQWFRMYSEFATDPKVQMLSEQDQRRFVMVLCMRCSFEENSNALRNGVSNDEVAFFLRISLEEWLKTKATLMQKNMLGDDNLPTRWDTRQKRSDLDPTRAERQRRFREKHKEVDRNALRNATVTPLEQNRIDIKEKELTNVSSKKKVHTHDLLKRFGVTEQLADDFVAHRRMRKAAISETAMRGIESQAQKAGITTAQAVEIMIHKNWTGFNHKWDWNDTKVNGRHNNENDPILIAKRRKAQRDNEMYEWAWGTGDADPWKNDLEGTVIDLRAKVC